ncbi:MAG: MOSC domain-containing protein [Planctomycetaceae bacterium]
MSSAESMESQFARAGRVEWVGVAAEPKGPLAVVQECRIEAGSGIVGEHHAGSADPQRQVTLIQHEHLATVAGLTGHESVDPGELRRNVVVSGINLLSLQDRTFRLGEALLEGSGPCEPCDRMEQNLGPGGYNAMNGHGGICARVLEAGTVRVGDTVSAASGTPAPSQS